MKTCEKCGREFLDSYESCPFCARAFTLSQPPPSPPRSRAPLLAGIAVMLILAAGVIGWQVLAARMSAATIGVAQKAACFSKQIDGERGAMVHAATNDDDRVADLAALVPADLDVVPACPYGGTLGVSWTADRPQVTCSKHGWHGDER